MTVRHRAYVEGMGTTVAADVLAGDTILPLESIAMFSSTGGMGITDGQVFTYTGRTDVAPGAAPVLALTAGTGLGSGIYQYAYTFVTAAGESLPGPSAAILTGPLNPPTTAPTGTLQTGGSIEVGTYQYAVSFVTASGETTAPVASSSISTYQVPAPSSAAVLTEDTDPSNGSTQWSIGDLVKIYITYINAAGESLPSAVSNTITAHQAFSTFPHVILVSSIPVSADTTVTSKRLYIYANGSSIGYNTLTASQTNARLPIATPFAGSIPVVSTADVRTIALTGIPVGASGTTSRKIYRSSLSVPTYKLQSTIADNITTTATDTLAQASLGATAPVSNTASMNQVALSSVGVGPTGTTSRKVYRTAVGASQLQLQSTIANNTTTTLTDSTADGSLGANVPTTDTAGLTSAGFGVVNGAASAGATTITLVATTSFSSTGGWFSIGAVTVRYTGKSATQLTGIPTAGTGSITVAIPSGSIVQALVALTGIPASGVGSLVRNVIVGQDANLLVQVDDTAAQAVMAALDGGDGIYEHYIQDRRLSIAGATARGTAELTLGKDPDETVTFTSEDWNCQSGRSVTVDVGEIAVTVKIQKVRTYWKAGRWLPQRDVIATNRFKDFYQYVRDLEDKASS